MAGVTDLDELIKNMTPELQQGDFVFCTVEKGFIGWERLKPLSTFQEQEGLTLIVSADTAREAGLEYEGIYKQITLTVHSSLDAVGLTATVATALASRGISANVVAAYYHDHIFVQAEKADKAMQALREVFPAKK